MISSSHHNSPLFSFSCYTETQRFEMAPKSDFAQKLLHDLRLRKERMGASQGSAPTNATPRDAYRNQGNVQTGGSKTMNHQLISSKGSNRTPNINESSQQIVSYSGGHHRRSESIGDLSMSFTYAVKNGEKLMNMDFSRSGNTNTMIGFLHQIGRRSLDVGNTRNQTTTTSIVKHRASNSGGVVTPALTTIQIKEISEGVQNLYEIIRSSSNGTNVNRYSMEVGKELLKGAKGLEESLKMLVNLQEASELMVTPKRKSRVTLQEVDGDDCYDRSKSVDQNQVDLPRFSFDKRSRRSNLVLTANKFPTHQRSVSCGGESVKSASNVKNKNNSGCSEKGRISNVIAKLMGLEEVFEFKNANDSNTNTINKISRPAKDSQVSLNNQKSQQIHYSNINSINKSSKPEKNGLVLLNDRKSQQILDLKQSNNRLNQISEKKERQLHNGESKEKINSKSRSPEVAENLPVDKKKTIRTEKNNEIKLIPRNNKIREPEKRVQKSKQDSQQIKQIKDTYSSPKEPKTHTFEQNPKAIVSTLKTQEPERTQQKMMPVTRKKVDSRVVSKTEAPRTKDEVLKPRNRMLNNLTTPSKHKLSVLKETKRKDVSMHLKSDENNSSKKDLKKTESTIRLDNIVSLQSGSELVRGPENARPPLMFNDDVLLPMISQVPECENEIKSDPEIASEIIFVGSRERKRERSNISKNKAMKNQFYPSIQVVLTENEKQLKEILIKDQLFLSTTEALFKLNIPVGFLHVDDHIHHNNESKLKLDCGYEILKRKARSQELSVHPYVKPSIGGTIIRLLDELVKQLYKDLESLTLYGRDASNEYDEANYLHHMLDRDIYNKNHDINSFWDFGWNITTFTFVEKDEFVNDVEQDVLHILVDEIVDDLLSMSLPF